MNNIRKKFHHRRRIHKEGISILLTVFAFLAVLNVCFYLLNVSSVFFIINLIISILAFLFFLYFFRNPQRAVYISDNSLVLAPADGRVVAIEPTEVYDYFGGQKLMQISIFMSVLSVHANWYPVNGYVRYVHHKSGRHRAAYLPKSSSENERSAVVIETYNKQKIMVCQIAGALARRIVTYAAPNHAANLNEHLGFIKFGSRVDVFLPLNATLFVQIGETTRGNETIIARLNDEAMPPSDLQEQDGKKD